MQAGIDFTARCMAAEALANGGGGGTTDYTQLSNKPSINDIELDGNKTSANLGLQSAIDSTHKLDADLVDDTSSTNKFATAAELAQIETNKTNISSFGYKIKEIALSSLNFSQATGGLFYSNLLDYSSEFDVIYSVNLNGFNNLGGNWAIMFSVKADTTSFSIVIQDPTNPATLTVGSAVIKPLIFGKLKQP